MTSSLFSAAPIELEAAGAVPARLLPLDRRSCARLAAGIVAMEPWSVMNYPADKLAALLAIPDASAARYVVSVKGEEAGVVSVRHPWLKGPYLELLALLPEAQSQGIGSSIMAWFESAGLKHGARNLWVCASSFNARALRFLRTPRLYPRRDAAGPRRRRLRRNSAAQISARPSAVTRSPYWALSCGGASGSMSGMSFTSASGE